MHLMYNVYTILIVYNIHCIPKTFAQRPLEFKLLSQKVSKKNLGNFAKPKIRIKVQKSEKDVTCNHSMCHRVLDKHTIRDH